MDLVFQHLELVEKDYFGLQYAENGATACTHSPDIMVASLVKFIHATFARSQLINSVVVLMFQRWLDPTKPVKKQIRSKGKDHI